MRMVLLSLATLLVAIAQARAHERWADGGPVPEWVKSQCCGPADAHHLSPDEVRIDEGGYRVAGYRGLIPESRRLPSPDGSWWVFYRDYPDGTQSTVYCFFGPVDGS